MTKSLVLLLAVFLVFGCTAVQQQKSQAAAADDLQFRNLKVFPQNIPREQLIAAMRGFSRGLGVRCNFCHVPTTPPSDELDFASDAKDEKEIARMMLRMTQRINADVAKIPDDDDHHEGGSHAAGSAAPGATTSTAGTAPTAPAGAAPTAAVATAVPHGNEPRVTCWTCHRGKTEPELPPAAAPPPPAAAH